MLYNLMNMFVFSILALAFMYIGKLIMDAKVAKHYNADLIIEEEDNFAVALRRGGFYFGIAMAMSASIVAQESFLQSLIHQTINGVMILIFLFTSMWTGDKILLGRVKNVEQLKSGNIAVGLLEASLYISTGLIAYASFKGVDGPFISGIVFFAMGQFLLISIAKAYELIHKGIFKKIENGNIAASVIVGSVMIAYSIILMSAILGEFVSWKQDIVGFLVAASIGVFMLLLLANRLIETFFLPTSSFNREIEQENYAAMFVIGALKIGIALIIFAVSL